MFQKLKNIYHLIQALLANIIYGFPSRKLKVVGVTGTDGKTTTTHLIAHILRMSGKKVSFISSVHASIAGKEYDIGFHVTTPSPFSLQKFLRKSADSKDDYFILETTSHALDQNRVWGIKYEIGVLTNITHEHLDYHKTYEEYLLSKIKLLKMARISVINEEDGSYKYINKLVVNHKKIYKKFKLIDDNFPNLTKFNKYNFSAAYLVCKILKLKDSEILRFMSDFQLPKGRLETVYDKNFKIIIDFAHTPNAFDNLLSELKKNVVKGSRLIHVFGSAGLRDVGKRNLMGEISSRYSDLLILTEEDYRTEDPKIICQQIASGILNNKPYKIILDRNDAIQAAINEAKKGDLVILTGKSHEKSLCRGKTEIPWSEHDAVQKALKMKV